MQEIRTKCKNGRISVLYNNNITVQNGMFFLLFWRLFSALSVLSIYFTFEIIRTVAGLETSIGAIEYVFSCRYFVSALWHTHTIPILLLSSTRFQFLISINFRFVPFFFATFFSNSIPFISVSVSFSFFLRAISYCLISILLANDF